MNTCRWIRDVERHFDGEPCDGEALLRHVAECPACGEHVRRLERLREAVGLVRSEKGIGEGQMPAFLEGIREKAGRRGSRRFPFVWAGVSVAAAALIVTISLYAVITGGPAPVQAETVIESYSTELERATVTYHNEEDGTAVVWVHVPDGDIW